MSYFWNFTLIQHWYFLEKLGKPACISALPLEFHKNNKSEQKRKSSIINKHFCIIINIVERISRSFTISRYDQRAVCLLFITNTESIQMSNKFHQFVSLFKFFFFLYKKLFIITFFFFYRFRRDERALDFPSGVLQLCTF